jgi:phosphate:Na+ symporter
MDIYDILRLMGGLCLFLFGMHILGDGLANLSSGRLEQLLTRFTSSKFRAVVLGAGVTAVIQSSSAVTVMVVALVNSGVVQLTQAVPVIMGANIGTTITAWILSLSGLSGDSFIVKIFQPEHFTPILALIGIILLFTTKKERKQAIASTLLGFSVLMYGMNTMSDSLSGLQYNERFISLFTIFKNPVLGILLGMLVTAVIQSSSASVGILQALSHTGAINFTSAFPIIMGQNIGTCITALISSIGSNRNAKRAATIHLFFNLTGTVVFATLFYLVNWIHPFSFMESTVTPVNIAIVHSIFNITTTLWMLPFSDKLVALSKVIVREEDDGSRVSADEMAETLRLMDERFLSRPAVAVEQARRVLNKMMETATDALQMSFGLLSEFDPMIHQEVEILEQQVDTYEDRLSEYCAKILGKELSDQDSQSLTFILHAINDIERISDHAINIADQGKKKSGTGQLFSAQAMEDISLYLQAVNEIAVRTQAVVKDPHSENLPYIEPLEDRINEIHQSMTHNHIDRLKHEQCTMENGMIISEIYNNLERVADHCSNLGLYRIQFPIEQYRTHEYQAQFDRSDEHYQQIYQNYVLTYPLSGM